MKLHPRAMDVLGYLAKHRGEVVTHDVLLATFWRGDASSPNSVHKCAAELRRAFATEKSADKSVHIDTIPKRGYRLNVSLEVAESGVSSSWTAPASELNGGSPAAVDLTPPAHPPADAGRKRSRFRVAAGVLLLAMVAGAFLLLTRDDPHPALAPSELQVKADLAVLRFHVEGEDRLLAAIAEGIPRAVASKLNRAGAVSVVDPDLSFEQSVSKVDIAEIGRVLGVGHILNGRVRRAGDSIRVEARLISADDAHETQILSRDLHGEELSISQGEPIDDIVETLLVLLDPEAVAGMQAVRTRSVKAYLAWKEAEQLRRNLDPESLDRASDILREAVELDPGFLEAYTTLAASLKDRTFFETDAAKRKMLLAEIQSILETLIRIDPSYDGIPVIRIMTAAIAPSWEQLETEVRMTIRDTNGDPRNDSLLKYVDILKTGRLFDEAARYLARYQPPPRNEDYAAARRMVIVQLTEGPAAAIPLMKRVLEQFPNDLANLYGIVRQLSAVGDFAQAEYYLAHLKEVDPSNQWAYGAWLEMSVMRGDLTVGSPALEQALDSPFVSFYSKGLVLLILGEVEPGLTAWRQMDPGLYELAFYYTVNGEVFFPESVRADPRYQQFLDEFGIGRQWTEYLRSKVAELAPLTGIFPAAPTAQKVFNASRDFRDKPLTTAETLVQ